MISFIHVHKLKLCCTSLLSILCSHLSPHQSVLFLSSLPTRRKTASLVHIMGIIPVLDSLHWFYTSHSSSHFLYAFNCMLFFSHLIEMRGKSNAPSRNTPASPSTRKTLPDSFLGSNTSSQTNLMLPNSHSISLFLYFRGST